MTVALTTHLHFNVENLFNKSNPPCLKNQDRGLCIAIVMSIICSPFASANNAAWQKIGTSKVGTSFYLDPKSLEEHGKKRVVMILEDRKNTAKVRNHSYRSYVSMQVHDCQGRRSAIVSGVFFSGNMGMGAVVHKYKVHRWSSDFELVAAGTMQEVIHRELCLGSWFDPSINVSI